MSEKIGSTGSKAARTIGSAFAHVQHMSDLIIEWGMLKMKQQGTKPVDPAMDAKRHPLVKRASSAGKFALGFFGEMGESYYKHYEKLKRDT